MIGFSDFGTTNIRYLYYPGSNSRISRWEGSNSIKVFSFFFYQLVGWSFPLLIIQFLPDPIHQVQFVKDFLVLNLFISLGGTLFAKVSLFYRAMFLNIGILLSAGIATIYWVVGFFALPIQEVVNPFGISLTTFFPSNQI